MILLELDSDFRGHAPDARRQPFAPQR